MSTIVNTPAQPTESSSNMFGWVFALIIVLAIVGAIIFYGIPALRSVSQPAAPQINVPDKVDVNVKQGQ